MRFGNWKHIYNHKPRKYPAELRRLLDLEFKDLEKISAKNRRTFTRAEIENAKKKIRKKIFKDTLRERLLYIVIVIALFIGIWWFMR